MIRTMAASNTWVRPALRALLVSVGDAKRGTGNTTRCSNFKKSTMTPRSLKATHPPSCLPAPVACAQPLWHVLTPPYGCQPWSPWHVLTTPADLNSPLTVNESLSVMRLFRGVLASICLFAAQLNE